MLEHACVAARLPCQDGTDSSGERGAWFRDSEGNMLGASQLVR